jgi:glycosyltransferase involved in cell wall biosynthesis
MKIGIIVDEFFSGGFQKVALMEKIQMDRNHINADLISLKRPLKTGYKDILEENKINLICIDDNFPKLLKLNFKFPFFSFFSLFHLTYPFFINKYYPKFSEYDAIVVHGTYTIFSAISIKRRFKDIKLISFIHDPISYVINQKYKSGPIYKFSRILVKLTTIVDRKLIANSDYVLGFPQMTEIMKNIYPKYNKYINIQNGVDVINENTINYKKDNYWISVTKWDKGKNIQFLIELCQKIGNNFNLKVIGTFVPETLRTEFEDHVKTSKLKNIDIIGMVSEKELNMYYKNAKGLVHPCREAFGMTILEAAANGCPAVFTNNSGVAKLFENEVANILPNENDIEEYIKAINYIEGLYSNNSHIKYIKRLRHTAEKYSWEMHNNTIINLIDKNEK